VASKFKRQVLDVSVKHIIDIMLPKIVKNKFKFVEVIRKKV